jgi:hypothetical protein
LFFKENFLHGEKMAGKSILRQTMDGKARRECTSGIHQADVAD